MKAIHVNTSSSWGGLEQYTVFVMERLREAGVDIVAMALPGTPLYARLLAAGFPIIDAVKSAHVSIADILALRRHLGKDVVVHTHMRKDVWLASLACIGTKSRHIYMAQMVPTRKRDPWHRFIYRRIHAIHNTSATHVKGIIANWPVDAQRVHHFGHMRSPEIFHRHPEQRRQLRTAWQVKPDDVVVGMITRIDPLKGVREFADSFELLPDDVQSRVQYVIVGAPTYSTVDTEGRPVYEQASLDALSYIQERVDSGVYRNKLQLLPFSDHPEYVMSALDVFVLATYGEMYALTVLEAMMCGCVVIGSNSGGTPDQLENGRGVLVEPRSAQAIATAVTYLVRNPGERASMAEAGYHWVMENHTVSTVLPKFLDLYNKTLR